MQDGEKERLNQIIEGLNNRLAKSEGKAERYKALFWLLFFLVVVCGIIRITSKN